VRRALLVAAAVLFAVVAIASGIHRGEDIENHLRLSDRLLHGLNFYEPRPPFGTWWLPAAIGLLTPFALLARLSLPVAKGAFAALSLVLLYWTITRTPSRDWRYVALALVAVAGPILFDFRYLNVSVILLALVVAGARDLESGNDVRAGCWIGLATALKLFPALLLVYLAARRRWRAVFVGSALAVVLTLIPLLALGPHGAVDTVRSWLDLSAAGMPVRRLGNQSVTQLIERLGAPASVALALRIAVLGATAWLLTRRRSVWIEVAAVTLAAVLVTPIAWWYYFVLAYPVWIVVLERIEPRAHPAFAAVLAATAFLMCGVLGPRAAGVPVLSAGIFTWAALSLFVALLVVMARTSRIETSPA